MEVGTKCASVMGNELDPKLAFDSCPTEFVGNLLTGFTKFALIVNDTFRIYLS